MFNRAFNGTPDEIKERMDKENDVPASVKAAVNAALGTSGGGQFQVAVEGDTRHTGVTMRIDINAGETTQRTARTPAPKA